MVLCNLANVLGIQWFKTMNTRQRIYAQISCSPSQGNNTHCAWTCQKRSTLDPIESHVHRLYSYYFNTVTFPVSWPYQLYILKKKESTDCMQPIIKKSIHSYRNKNCAYIEIKHIFAVKDVITGLHFGNHKTNRTSVTIKIKTCIWSLIKHTNMHTLTVSEITLTFFSTSHKSHNDKKKNRKQEKQAALAKKRKNYTLIISLHNKTQTKIKTIHEGNKVHQINLNFQATCTKRSIITQATIPKFTCQSVFHALTVHWSCL